MLVLGFLRRRSRVLCCWRYWKFWLVMVVVGCNVGCCRYCFWLVWCCVLWLIVLKDVFCYLVLCSLKGCWCLVWLGRWWCCYCVLLVLVFLLINWYVGWLGFLVFLDLVFWGVVVLGNRLVIWWLWCCLVWLWCVGRG